MQRLLLARECGDEVHGLDDILSAQWASLDIDPTRQYTAQYCDTLSFIDIDRPTGSLILCGGSTSLEYGDTKSASVGVFNHAETGMKGTEDHLVKYTYTRPCATVVQFTCGRWFPYDAAIFVTGSSKYGEVIIWDTERFAPVTSFDLGSMDSEVVSTEMSLAPGARTELIAAGCKDSTDLVLVDMSTGASTHRLEAHNYRIRSIVWAPISPYLVASVDCGGFAFLFDIRRSGKTACLVQFDQSRRIPTFDTARPSIPRSQVNRGYDSPLNTRLLDKANVLGLSCVWNRNSERRASMKRFRSGIKVGLRPMGRPLKRARFSPDGSTLITADCDGVLRVWDVLTGRLVRTYKTRTDLTLSWTGAFEISRDGLHILCSRRGGLMALDLEEGGIVHDFENANFHEMNDLTLHPLYEEALSVDRNIITSWSACEKGKLRSGACPG